MKDSKCSIYLAHHPNDLIGHQEFFSLNLMKYSHILNTAREIAFGYAASQSEWMNQVRM